MASVTVVDIASGAAGLARRVDANCARTAGLNTRLVERVLRDG